jgi:hypothetical protein
LLDTGLGDYLLDQRQGLSDMISGRKFWNYTAILRVYFNLAVQTIGQKTALAVI